MKRFLTTRAGFLFCVALGVVLCLPSITTGLVADDWIHKLVIEHRPLDGTPRGPLDLFTFATGRPAENQRFIDLGAFSWWSDPNVLLSFLRPLTSLTHLLDYALWPQSPVAMHLQNLFWFALGIAGAGWVYRRVLPIEVAGLSLLIFAIDQVHGPTVAWIANRNMLVAMALAVPSLGLHHRWRTDGWRPGAWLAPLCLAAGLFAGEAAIAIAGYLVAYALHMERGTWRQRALSLAPYGVVIVGWQAVYKAFNAGASGSGLYFDPMREPRLFIEYFPVRAASLLASEFFGPFSDFQSMYGYFSARVEQTMAAVAFATVALSALLFSRQLRTDPVARMFGTGLTLAVVPLCATFPADRLLFFVSIGAAPLIAQFILSASGFLRRSFATLLVLNHLIVSPFLLALRSLSMQTVDRPLARALHSIPPDLTGRTLVLVNPPGAFMAAYLQFTLAAQDKPRPTAVRWLTAGPDAVEMTRNDAQTLTVHPEGGFYRHASEQLFRSPTHPIPPGTTVRLSGLSIEVLSAEPDGRPREARFHFDRPLEDPSLVWMKMDGTTYAPFTLPPVGGSVTLPATDFLKAVLSE